MSDAGHNLGDVFSLLLALIAFKLSATKPNERFTYGYRKGSVLISLLNAIILLVAVGAILLESIHKFANPAPVDGSAIAWTAAAGIVVNGFTAYLIMRHQKNDINTRGAFLHMAADTLVSVGVVISGIVISLTGWTVIDPIVSIIIAVVILVSTWQLLSESVRMSIDAVPESVKPSEVPHVVLSEGVEPEAVVPEVKKHLKHCGISHATLETEREGHACGEQECC